MDYRRCHRDTRNTRRWADRWTHSNRRRTRNARARLALVPWFCWCHRRGVDRHDARRSISASSSRLERWRACARRTTRALWRHRVPHSRSRDVGDSHVGGRENRRCFARSGASRDARCGRNPWRRKSTRSHRLAGRTCRARRAVRHRLTVGRQRKPRCADRTTRAS